MKAVSAWFSLIIMILFLIACVTTSQQEAVPVVPADPVIDSEIPDKVPERIPERPSEIQAEDSSVEISHEVYEKTFGEVGEIIEELNGIIKSGNYNMWVEFLTPRFIREIMDPLNIDRINDQPVLKRNNIVIKTLSDYFMYVVVPSRASVRLDDLVFTDTDRVRAFMFIRDERVLIYQLEQIEGKWKISTWQNRSFPF